MAIGRITRLPYVGEPTNDTLKTHEVFVTAIPDPIPKPDVVPLWIVVLAACAGALILLLLIYLLYKVRIYTRRVAFFSVANHDFLFKTVWILQTKSTGWIAARTTTTESKWELSWRRAFISNEKSVVVLLGISNCDMCSKKHILSFQKKIIAIDGSLKQNLSHHC